MFQKSCAQPEVTILHLGGGPSSVELKDIIMYIVLSRSQDPVSRLYHHLILPPQFLYPLLSLINNCLNLLFRTRGRSGRLNKCFYPMNKK